MDLVGPYSKRLDLADGLVKTVQRLRRAQERSDEQSVSVRSTGRNQRQWQVTDRLSEADVRLLTQAFAGGTPKWKLAEQYGISESSVEHLYWDLELCTGGSWEVSPVVLEVPYDDHWYLVVDGYEQRIKVWVTTFTD